MDSSSPLRLPYHPLAVLPTSKNPPPQLKQSNHCAPILTIQCLREPQTSKLCLLRSSTTSSPSCLPLPSPACRAHAVSYAPTLTMTSYGCQSFGTLRLVWAVSSLHHQRKAGGTFILPIIPTGFWSRTKYGLPMSATTGC